jgi:uncharacterized protein with GYD domain
MAKYLLQVNYTSEGARGLHKDGGTKRHDVAANAAKSFYFCFGEYDVVCIADMPDAVSAAALSLAVTESGAAETSTTPLLSAEEMDHAVSKHSAYRKPGA